MGRCSTRIGYLYDIDNFSSRWSDLGLCCVTRWTCANLFEQSDCRPIQHFRFLNFLFKSHKHRIKQWKNFFSFIQQRPSQPWLLVNLDRKIMFWFWLQLVRKIRFEFIKIVHLTEIVRFFLFSRRFTDYKDSEKNSWVHHWNCGL